MEEEIKVDLEDEAGWMIFRPKITTLTMEEPFPNNLGDVRLRVADLTRQLKTPYVDFLRKDGNAVYKVVWVKGDTRMPLIQPPVRERIVPDFIPPKND